MTKSNPWLDELGQKKETKFTNAELNQLLEYCFYRDEDGWYYGNKEQFEKRHQSIIEKLKQLIRLTDK